MGRISGSGGSPIDLDKVLNDDGGDESSSTSDTSDTDTSNTTDVADGSSEVIDLGDFTPDESTGVDSPATRNPGVAGVSPSTNIENNVTESSGGDGYEVTQTLDSKGGTVGTPDYAPEGTIAVTEAQAADGMDAIEESESAAEQIAEKANDAAETANEAEESLPLSLIGVAISAAGLAYAVMRGGS